jgi:transposase
VTGILGRIGVGTMTLRLILGLERPTLGTVTTKKGRTEFRAFMRYLRSLHPPNVRIAIVLTISARTCRRRNDQRVAEWAEANNVEPAHTPTHSSWLNRIEAQFQALRYFALSGTDHLMGQRRCPASRTATGTDQLILQICAPVPAGDPFAVPASRFGHGRCRASFGVRHSGRSVDSHRLSSQGRDNHRSGAVSTFRFAP